jgi:hypothetical protein
VLRYAHIACLVIFMDTSRPAYSSGLQPVVCGPMHFCGRTDFSSYTISLTVGVERTDFTSCGLLLAETLSVPNQTSASWSH